MNVTMWHTKWIFSGFLDPKYTKLKHPCCFYLIIQSKLFIFNLYCFIGINFNEQVFQIRFHFEKLYTFLAII